MEEREFVNGIEVVYPHGKEAAMQNLSNIIFDILCRKYLRGEIYITEDGEIKLTEKGEKVKAK